MVNAIEIANQAINHYISELNFSLEEKTQANIELKKSKDAAIEMAIAKSQFLSNMSHEIRTPLNSVLGLLEVIDTSLLSDYDKKLVNTARDSGKDLVDIINDILIFSKLDIAKEKLKVSATCIEKKLNKNLEALQSVFDDKHIKLSRRIEISPTCEWVRCDMTRLGQVIKNLLGNALKFSHEGGEVHFLVTCNQKDKNSSELFVSVVDNGIGISTEHMKSIFDSFKQADGSLTRNLVALDWDWPSVRS